MTFDELKSMISEISWFHRLAEPDLHGEFVQIRTLAAWSGGTTEDQELKRIADQMKWLPSSRDQDDPILGRTLEDRAEQAGRKGEISRLSLDIYKTALSALSRFSGNPSLKTGAHDFTEAARGAALFASRRAAYEVLLGEPGFWCGLMKIYQTGHWPCGILRNGQVVVL